MESHRFICKLKQEGWLSPTERVSVSKISLRKKFWLPKESHAGMSLRSPVLRVEAFGYVKRLASPG